MVESKQNTKHTEVTVSITLSKTFPLHIRVDKYGKPIDLKRDFVIEHYSPKDVLDRLSVTPLIDSLTREDCTGWLVDDFAIIEE